MHRHLSSLCFPALPRPALPALMLLLAAASSLSDADDESEMGGMGDEEEEADSFICEDGYLSGGRYRWYCC